MAIVQEAKIVETFDKQLRYFIKIAEVKSLSRAADDLDCTQPALSRQLASLEAHLGCTLFVRTGRGMDLTDCGRRVLEEVRPAFANIDAAISTLRDRHELRGTLKLVSVHTLSYYFVSDLVKAFSERHTGINLSVMGRSSPEVVDLVESGKADVGFVYDTAVASDKLVSTPLFDDEMCLVVGPDCATADGVDLTTDMPKLIGFPPHYALRRMIHSSGLNPHFMVEAETVDVMLEMVASGVGVCILPKRIPDRVLNQYHLRKVQIANPCMSRRVVAIERTDRHELAVMKQLMLTSVEVARLAGMTTNDAFRVAD
ncbi:LysR family transcriptional regulator (plasmid) [Ralstonia sp. 25C]|uniref:LysR family transcriptional regulator n=1 Tax=Ralstonia sp. 25C TaxID=3447363 RepID=UPI003F754CFA